jgi:hypothetical protein
MVARAGRTAFEPRGATATGGRDGGGIWAAGGAMPGSGGGARGGARWVAAVAR